jgi:hypothetical protein
MRRSGWNLSEACPWRILVSSDAETSASALSLSKPLVLTICRLALQTPLQQKYTAFLNIERLRILPTRRIFWFSCGF